MIEIYYTNADKALDQQRNPRISLGGFVSSTKVPNDQIGNLFGDVSLKDMQELSRSTKAIALKNITGLDISSLSVYIDMPELPYAKFELAFAAVADNGTGPFMERIDNRRASPYVAEWNSPDANDPLQLQDTIQDQSYVGLWIRRQIIVPDIGDVHPGTIAALKQGGSIEINDQERTKQELQKETFRLHFHW